MKHRILRIVHVALSMIISITGYAEYHLQKLTLPVAVINIEVEEGNDEFSDEEIYPLIHRTTSATTDCGISRTTGVKISGNNIEIISYEIWTSDGEVCIFETEDEKDFTRWFFALSGTYQLRLFTENHLYVGLVSI